MIWLEELSEGCSLYKVLGSVVEYVIAQTTSVSAQ
jgi:hypothetical protein